VGRQELEELTDRWISDPEFRAAFRVDPERTVRDSGFELTPEELQDLSAFDDEWPDEELRPRVIRS
jgi:hypothetical protein